MRYLLLYCLLFRLMAGYAQSEEPSAVAHVRSAVLAAYEREASSKNTLISVKEQIRQHIISPIILLEYDDYFSKLVKKDRNKYTLSAELKTQIEKFITIDSLSHLITDWQQNKLQLLGLIKYDLTEENITNDRFSGTSKVFQYLSFFNIQSGESVAELGAGSGWLSLLMIILYNDINLYVNELGTYLLNNTQGNLRRELTKDQLKRCHFITGSKTSTGLETRNLNIVIAVDVFHHFNDKLSMLQAIKWSLAKGGRLCLVEQVRTIGGGDYFCPQALEKWQLEDLMHQNGFVKTRERLLHGTTDRNTYLLEYRVNPL